jgi:AbrB family looped-hinge helix DNA binding protein
LPRPLRWHGHGSVNGMRTTIDTAGRLVIPKSLREQSGIVSGEVEISLDGAAIRIESVAADDLVEEDGLLLLPNGGSEIDADSVRELRLADQR